MNVIDSTSLGLLLPHCTRSVQEGMKPPLWKLRLPFAGFSIYANIHIQVIIMINEKKTYVASSDWRHLLSVSKQSLAGEILADHAASMLSERSLSVMRKLFAHPSINSRYFAVDNSDTYSMKTRTAASGDSRNGPSTCPQSYNQGTRRRRHWR